MLLCLIVLVDLCFVLWLVVSVYCFTLLAYYALVVLLVGALTRICWVYLFVAYCESLFCLYFKLVLDVSCYADCFDWFTI